MANVTDPLARAVHGTNPQNLVEYITRQKIYDSRYWKEECFGLNATDIVEKATKLSTIGGSYGGNMKPCHFLCLVLKMLQIQPSDDIVEELVQNEDFKYVRALGAFYLRLTGRPKDIYELLEPLYHDYRKLRVRTITDWRILCVDEFVDELLRDSAVCGISLPRLPKRAHLEEAGYLEPRQSVLCGEASNAEKYLIGLAERGSEVAKNALIQRGILREAGEENGAAADIVDVEISTNQKDEDSATRNGRTEGNTPGGRPRSRSRSRSRSWGRRTREDERGCDRRDRDRHEDRRRRGDRDYRRSDVGVGSSGRHGEYSDERRSRRYDDVGRDEHRHRRRSEEGKPRYDDRERHERHQRTEQGRSRYDRSDETHGTYRHGDRTKKSHRDKDKDSQERGSRSKHRDREKKKKERTENFGSLFKEKSKPSDVHSRRRSSPSPNRTAPKEGSEEYWNEQRAKLGLKPLSK